MSTTKISLDDKYTFERTRAYMTGIQALARLPILQHQRDLNAGLNTAGFISGYRGSPLGGLDQTMWKVQTHLKSHNIVFQPGVNEELAATAVWGSQQVNLFEGAKYDGVFGMWYGKGPGVDRSMDVFKHANAFGTSKHGGVLAIAGDDHACVSSTLPHQSEHNFIGASIPVLNPGNTQEVLDYGIIGWQLSRYSGCWIALKAISENMDSGMPVDIDPSRVNIIIPQNFKLPEEGLNGRWPASPLEQERILNKFRIYAARNFARVNKLDKIALDSDNPRFGIITTGKSYFDVMQALEDLGIDENARQGIGLRVLKVGMSWPLEPTATHEFAEGLKEILVVEEKRGVIEDQLTGQLYNWPVEDRPLVVGEFDEQGNDLLTNLSELTPAMVARVIASRIKGFYTGQLIQDRLAFLETKEQSLANSGSLVRQPYYCSGCPHNTSTKVPEGSRAVAGIGCHFMAIWMDRNTDTFTQMGGEGASWIGQAPFTETEHIFQNLGDGTYHHSGLLAIRATLTAKVNITYKILYNDAVAMTGGQKVEGPLTVDMIVKQLHGEGVGRIAVVTDEPKKYPNDFPLLPGVSIHHRDEMDALQLEFRVISGTSVIIYDQTCAAEKRRRRKKKLLADPPMRLFINEEVCEGCGDCSVQSNCLSVVPKDTELGRKREIDQDACNKDFSCLQGFCPSFVSVTGGELRKKEAVLDTAFFGELPDPVVNDLKRPWNILVTGIGGTGVVTVGSVIAMAAFIEGKGCTNLNQTGLAQKFGAVSGHVRIAQKQEHIHAARISAGDADLLLGCDLVVSASEEALAKLHLGRSHIVINEHEAPTSEFISNRDLEFPSKEIKNSILAEVDRDRAHFINATDLATSLMGDSIMSNMFLVGFAYQNGLIPISAEAINKAIELNNVKVEFNQRAFLWGRQAAHKFDEVSLQANLDSHKPLTDIHEIIEWRKKKLIEYQDADYSQKYEMLVDKVYNLDKSIGNGTDLVLTKAIAKNLFKVMAYKDEYEVARLYSDGTFIKRLEALFEGSYTFNFHLAVPLFSRQDAATGELVKRRYPQVTLKVFSLLAKLKFLRGTKFDLFSYTQERKAERKLLSDYCLLIEKIIEPLTVAETSRSRYNLIVEIASLPKNIKGYGHIKMKTIVEYHKQKEKLLAQFN